MLTSPLERAAPAAAPADGVSTTDAPRSYSATPKAVKPAGRVLDPATLGDHLDRLFRAAWALCGSREEAEDLVQDTYARVLARPRLVRNDDDIGYLMRVLRNTFISNRRAAARRPQAAAVELEVLPLADISAGAANPPVVAETREVYAAIAALPETSARRWWRSM